MVVRPSHYLCLSGACFCHPLESFRKAFIISFHSIPLHHEPQSAGYIPPHHPTTQAGCHDDEQDGAGHCRPAKQITPPQVPVGPPARRRNLQQADGREAKEPAGGIDERKRRGNAKHALEVAHPGHLGRRRVVPRAARLARDVEDHEGDGAGAERPGAQRQQAEKHMARGRVQEGVVDEVGHVRAGPRGGHQAVAEAGLEHDDQKLHGEDEGVVLLPARQLHGHPVVRGGAGQRGGQEAHSRHRPRTARDDGLRHL